MSIEMKAYLQQNDINDKRGPLIAKQLREYAHNPGYNHADYSDVILKAADYIDAALPAMREYAKKNPLHHDGDQWQDPCGVHAWLKQNDA